MNLILRASKHFEIYKLMEAKVQRNMFDVVQLDVWTKVRNNVDLNVSNFILPNVFSDIHRSTQKYVRNQSISPKVKSSILNSLTSS